MATTVTTEPRAMTASKASAAGERRLVSLDVFRGVTILAMILVNNPGSWKAVYAPLRHAEWQGWTPTDLVFPFFLFVVGVSIVFSCGRRHACRETRGTQLLHVLWRSSALIAIGLLLNGLFYLPWSQTRIPGVLQRIGIVYFFAALITLTTNWRSRAAISAALLLGYWALLMLVPAPGHLAGDLTPDGNLASLIDRHLFAGHMWRPTWDPEGVLSSFPALATALLGTLAGDWLNSGRERRKIALGLLIGGAVGLSVGQLWSLTFPINKNLWTSSYAVFTGGAAALAMTACYWAIDVRGWRRPAEPFLWVGMNPLALYVASEIAAMGIIPDMRPWATHQLLGFSMSPKMASLTWAMLYVACWWVVAWVLYRRKVFIKL